MEQENVDRLTVSIHGVLEKCTNQCPSIRKLVDATIQALKSSQEAGNRFEYFLKPLRPDLDRMDPKK
jgi:hypothetical protein